MKLKTFAICSALVLLGFSQNNASAQVIQKQSFAYGHSIDILYGTNSVPYKLDMATNPTTKKSVGGKFDLRYTTYILPWAGAYIQVGMSNAKTSPTEYLSNMNKADNGLYKYKPYSINGFKESTDKMIVNRYKLHAEYGLAFRYNLYQFSLRPRIGFGAADYTFHSLAYERVSRDNESEAPVIYYRSLYQEANDFMLESKATEPSTVYAKFFTASTSLSYTFNKHFYANIEWGFRYSPTKMTIREKVYTATSDYNPTNWAEAVYTYKENTEWNFDLKNPEETLKTQKIGYSSYFQFGIGWNIGYDHTGKNWFHKFSRK